MEPNLYARELHGDGEDVDQNRQEVLPQCGKRPNGGVARARVSGGRQPVATDPDAASNATLKYSNSRWV